MVVFTMGFYQVKKERKKKEKKKNKKKQMQKYPWNTTLWIGRHNHQNFKLVVNSCI